MHQVAAPIRRNCCADSLQYHFPLHRSSRSWLCTWFLQGIPYKKCRLMMIPSRIPATTVVLSVEEHLKPLKTWSISCFFKLPSFVLSQVTYHRLAIHLPFRNLIAEDNCPFVDDLPRYFSLFPWPFWQTVSHYQTTVLGIYINPWGIPGPKMSQNSFWFLNTNDCKTKNQNHPMFEKQ